MSSSFLVTTCVAFASGMLVWARTAPDDRATPTSVVPGGAVSTVADDLREPPAESHRRPWAPTTSLSGTLVVQDELGVEHARTSGMFALWTSDGTKHVPVVDGAWELELAHDQSFSFGVWQAVEMSADDRIGRLTGGTAAYEEETRLAGDTELALEARWLARHELVVLDAETREPLDDLLILERTTLMSRFMHPGAIDEDDVLYGSTGSPVAITPRRELLNTYFVHRDGYAWTRIVLDHSVGGRHEVLLEPVAGDLDLRFSGAHEGPVQVRMSIEGNDWRDVRVEADGRDGLRLEGLPLGRYVLEARVNARSAAVRRAVEIVPGPNEVELEVPPHGEARVRLVDGTTGAVVTDATPDVVFDVADDVDVTYDARRQSWRLQASRARLRGKVIVGEAVSGALDVDLCGSAEPTELRLRPVRSLALDLYHGETLVEPKLDWFMDIQVAHAATGELALVDVDVSEAGLSFLVPEPGDYVVTFGELTGYAPIREADVTVRACADARVRVDLERVR